MFQVNYLSQVYLTCGLLPSMLTTNSDSPPRVIAIACESHRIECPGISMMNGIVSDRLSPRSPKDFDHLIAYGQSKLCLIMFISEFRRNYPRSCIDFVENRLDIFFFSFSHRNLFCCLSSGECNQFRINSSFISLSISCFHRTTIFEIDGLTKEKQRLPSTNIFFLFSNKLQQHRSFVQR